MAICLTRIQQGNFIPLSILRHEFLKDSWQFNYIERFFQPLFESDIRSISNVQMKAEIAFAYIFLFAQEYHMEDNKNIGEMLFYCQTHHLQAGEITNRWFQMFYQNFPLTTSAKDYSLLYANLIHKHVKALTFKGAGSLSGIDLGASVYVHPEINRRIVRIFDQLAQDSPGLLKNKQFLLDNYRFLISQYIEQERKTLSVCVLSVFGEEYLDMIKRHAFQGMDFEVIVSGDIDDTTDLVITDRKYEDIEFDKNKILYWENIPSKKSMYRIQTYIHEHFGYLKDA